MLVLTRRLGESICIDGDIRVTIQGVRGNQVRVGVTAPREKAVHREEIYQKIRQENLEASSSPIEMAALRELSHEVNLEEKSSEGKNEYLQLKTEGNRRRSQ